MDAYPEAPLTYWRLRVPLLQVALWMLTCALVALLIVTAWRLRFPPNPEQLRRYQGVEWGGDTCYVDDDGVLFCEGGGPQ